MALSRLLDRVVQRLAQPVIARYREEELHPRMALLRAAQADSAAYAGERMSDALIFQSREECLAHALARAPTDGAIIELGVAGGESARFLAGLTARPIHGFDSFEGLPEDWGGRHEAKGHYSTMGRLPEVPASVTLHKGWFSETLPPFRAANPGPIALLHVDCDLYFSTREALEVLGDGIVTGSVIAFDEYFNMPNWRRNEFRAFQEFVEARKIDYRYLCWAHQQAVVRINSIGGA